MARAFTPDVVTVHPDGRKTTTMHLKRACNGCGTLLGDVAGRDVDDDGNLSDVRGECPNCVPLVKAEAAGCKTWQLYPRDFNRIADEIDRLRPWVYTKPYWQPAGEERRNAVVGLRIGVGEGRVVAHWGDWIIRHPDGAYTVHKAPAEVA
jgi:hypothetical protein